MPRQMNATRNYSTVHGEGVGTVMYEQFMDGHVRHFNADYEEVALPGGEIPPDPPRQKSAASLVRASDVYKVRLEAAKLLYELEPSIKWPAWRARVTKMLGPDSGLDEKSVKTEIKAALEDFIADLEALSLEVSDEVILEPNDPTTKKPAKKEQELINLVEWGRGETEYTFGQIQDAMREEHNYVPTGRPGALQFLVENDLIPKGEIRQDIRN